MAGTLPTAVQVSASAVQPIQAPSLKPVSGMSWSVIGLAAMSASQTQIVPVGQVPKQLMPGGSEVTEPRGTDGSMVTLTCVVPRAVTMVLTLPASVLETVSRPERTPATIGEKATVTVHDAPGASV